MQSFDDVVLKKALKKFFGYDSFRPGQTEIIRYILEKRDLLAVMPNGAGRSLCYQLAASLLVDVKTIVVSPRVAQIDDRITALRGSGHIKPVFKAISIRPDLAVENKRKLWEKFNKENIALLYLEPGTSPGELMYLESGNSPGELMTLKVIEALNKLSIQTIIVDDAHCISKLDSAYRPDYEALSTLKSHFPETTVVAFTSSANQSTGLEIKQKIFDGKCATFLHPDTGAAFVSLNEQTSPPPSPVSEDASSASETADEKHAQDGQDDVGVAQGNKSAKAISHASSFVGKESREQIDFVLNEVLDGLTPFVEKILQEYWGAKWIEELDNDKEKANKPRTKKKKNGSIKWDAPLLLSTLNFHWKELFEDRELGRTKKSYIGELQDIRNKWAHPHQGGDFNLNDILRALDTAQRLMSVVSAQDQAEKLGKAHEDLLRFRWGNKSEK